MPRESSLKRIGKKATSAVKNRGSSGITRRWFFNNVSVVFATLLVIGVSASIGISQSYHNSVHGRLESKAESSARYLSRYLTNSYTEFYNYSLRLVADFNEREAMEMQVTDQYGRVLFSSAELTAGFPAGTPDVMQSINEGSTRYFYGEDQLTGEKVMSCTSQVSDRQGQVIGAVRYITSMRLVDRHLTQLFLMLFGAMLVVLALIVVTNSYFIRSIVGPIVKINHLAQTIAGGQYGARMDVEFNDEVGELCNTLNNMSLELARMEKVKNDFISSVSHELRTPLTAINGWAETVAHDLDDPMIASAGLDVIKKETSRLSHMVEELLDFSRIESGALRLQAEPFDVRGQLYDAVFMYNDMLKSQNLEVRYEEPEDPIMILGDKNRLKQVFLNIIDNAAKYGTGGSWLDIRVMMAEGLCSISFRDYGQGIPEKELPFVKEKFFKGSARGRGTGIGLAVCSEIIELHGGELNIESVFGEGTTVGITLPMLTELVG